MTSVLYPRPTKKIPSSPLGHGLMIFFSFKADQMVTRTGDKLTSQINSIVYLFYCNLAKQCLFIDNLRGIPIL